VPAQDKKGVRDDQKSEFPKICDTGKSEILGWNRIEGGVAQSVGEAMGGRGGTGGS